MSLRISDLARRRQLDVVAELLGSSWLWLCTGTRPSKMSDAVKESAIIARVFLGKQGFRIEDDAQGRPQAVTHGVEAIVGGSGHVTWFSVRQSTPPNDPVVDGLIGVNGGDLPLTRVDLLPGDKIIIDRLAIQIPQAD